MKNDQFIPHEVSARSNSRVINLIENEGAAGYGLYWAILEYLRAQDRYVGDVRALRNIARHLKVRIDKALRVLNNYGLFVIELSAFYSPMLCDKMQPLERSRAGNWKKRSDNVSGASFNPLRTSDDSPKEENRIEEKKETSDKEKTMTSWETYVDALSKELGWIEVMAMRSGLGLAFVKCFPEVLRHFKQHVVALGKEDHIRSLNDAKQYFNNFNTPGSKPFLRLVAELQKPIDKGKYKHEDVDPATGARSYCGVPIPADAPPRPNSQAVWNEEKWIY